MTILRALGVLTQARLSLSASRPPHPTDSKSPPVRQYHTETPRWVDKIIPTIGTLQSQFFWGSAVLECGNAAYQVYRGVVFDYSDITPLFVVSMVLGIAGALIRLECFKALGHLFTFELTVQPEHRLVQHGPYAYVRHPAYTSGILMCFGSSLTHLVCPESLSRQIIGPILSYIFCGVLWAWLVGTGTKRAITEDEEMHREFGKEWEGYAQRVRWWFIPGII